MALNTYEMGGTVNSKLIWPKFTRENNSRSYADDKEIERYDPGVHLLAHLLRAGAIKRVR